MKIPPRGRSGVSVEWSKVPYGADISVRLRMLEMEATIDMTGIAFAEGFLKFCRFYEQDPISYLEAADRVLEHPETVEEEDEGPNR